MLPARFYHEVGKVVSQKPDENRHILFQNGIFMFIFIAGSRFVFVSSSCLVFLSLVLSSQRGEKIVSALDKCFGYFLHSIIFF